MVKPAICQIVSRFPDKHQGLLTIVPRFPFMSSWVTAKHHAIDTLFQSRLPGMQYTQGSTQCDASRTQQTDRFHARSANSLFVTKEQAV